VALAVVAQVHLAAPQELLVARTQAAAVALVGPVLASRLAVAVL